MFNMSSKPADKPLTVGDIMDKLADFDRSIPVKMGHPDLGGYANIHKVIDRTNVQTLMNEVCVVLKNTDDFDY